MSTKKNALLPIAAAALGLTLTANAKPVAEGLLNDYQVKALDIAQVNAEGQCVVLATVHNPSTNADEVRAVCSANGDVKTFGGIDACAAVIAKAKLDSAVVVRYKRKDKEVNASNPVAKLKAAYKSFVNEKKVADDNLVKIGQLKAAMQGLGYHTASGTPEAAEYADVLVREGSVTEWKAFVSAKVTALAASLVAAGVDPAQVN